MGMWDGIRSWIKPKPRKPHGLFGIEDAAVRHRWVTPLLVVAFAVLVVVAFKEAAG